MVEIFSKSKYLKYCLDKTYHKLHKCYIYNNAVFFTSYTIIFHMNERCEQKQSAMKNTVYIKFQLQPLRINEFNKYMLMVNNNIFFVCLVILEVSVTYYTIWYFTNVLPSTCKKLSSHLISSDPILEEIFIDQCKDLIIHRSVIFTFSTLPFTVYLFNYFFLHSF